MAKDNYPPELYNSRMYRAWMNMKTRCGNPNYIEFHRYGGRGIGHCAEWDRFSNFYRDMAEGYDDTLTLDRIDNDRGYSKENCRWVSVRDQMNNRSTSRLITIGDSTKTLAQWVHDRGLKPSTVRQRFYVYKWTIEKSLGMES